MYWTVCGVIFVSSVKLRWMNSRFDQFEFRYSPSPQTRSRVKRLLIVCAIKRKNGHDKLPWCTTPIEAESSLGPDSHHPIISLSGIPSAVMVLRILHPILASTLCAANPLARIAEPTIAL